MSDRPLKDARLCRPSGAGASRERSPPERDTLPIVVLSLSRSGPWRGVSEAAVEPARWLPECLCPRQAAGSIPAAEADRAGALPGGAGNHGTAPARSGGAPPGVLSVSFQKGNASKWKSCFDYRHGVSPGATAESLSPGRPLSPVGRPLSPVGRPLSPVGRPLSPVGRPLSPVGRPLSPVGRPLSPVGRPLSPVGRPLSPVGRPLSPLSRPIPPGSRASYYSASLRRPPWRRRPAQKFCDLLLFTQQRGTRCG
jgi:hypothetical protein